MSSNSNASDDETIPDDFISDNSRLDPSQSDSSIPAPQPKPKSKSTRRRQHRIPERIVPPTFSDDEVYAFFASLPPPQRAPYCAPPEPKPTEVTSSRRPTRAKKEALERRPVPRLDPDEMKAGATQPSNKPIPPDRNAGVKRADKDVDDGAAKGDAQPPSERKQSLQTRNAAKGARTGG
jgi:hypothetical protein